MSEKKNPKNNDTAKEDLEKVLDEAIEEAEETQKNEAKNEAENHGKTLSETESLKEELEKEKDKFLRLFAEFENYKRRTGKERMELFKTANQEVLHSLLPILDDFDRALPELKKSGDDNLLKGVELIHDKLRETLKNKGLEQISVKPGDTFDADLHEAVSQIPAPEKKLKGKIVDVIEKGYTLGDKIIRYPKVITGK